MADSRRINSNIQEEESRLSAEEQPPFPLSAIILSSEFWPTLKEEKLQLPPVVGQAMEAYTHRYEKLKVSRELELQPRRRLSSQCEQQLRAALCFLPGHEDPQLEASPGLRHPGRGAGGPRPHQLHRLAHPRCHHSALPGQKYSRTSSSSSVVVSCVF